jgi:hypothetical protein
MAACESQHLSDQLAQLSVSQDDDALGGPDVQLVRHRERGGQRLNERRLIVAHALWHRMLVRSGQCHIVGKDAIVPPYTQRSARWAVAGPTCATGLAITTGDVDLTNNALSDPDRAGWAGFHDAYEFVAQHPVVIRVSLDKLQVSVADPGPEHAYQCLAFSQVWYRVVGLESNAFVTSVQDQRAHNSLPSKCSSENQSSFPI